MLIEFMRQTIRHAIQGTPFEQVTYFAGGCVRDFLLNRESTDFDLTVEMDEGGIRLAEHLFQTGVSSKPVVYKQFGTAMVKIGKYKTELVMTRSESYRAACRKPKVKFGSLYEDVMRRDFTINSLLMRISDAEILDLSGNGLADLQKKTIRATSTPETIFREDPLRLLRAVRIATTLGFEIEPVTMSAIKKTAEWLKYISAERTGEEFTRIMRSDAWWDGAMLLINTKLMPGITWQTLPRPLKLPQNINLLRPEALQLLPSLSLWARYWLLFGSRYIINHILSDLKCPLSEQKKIEAWTKAMEKLEQLTRTNEITDFDINSFVYFHNKLFPEFFEQCLLLSPLMVPKPDAWIEPRVLIHLLQTRAKEWQYKKFCLTGDDLLRSFCLKSSPLIGEMLTEALGYWFVHPEATKKDLIGYLQDLYEGLV